MDSSDREPTSETKDEQNTGDMKNLPFSQLLFSGHTAPPLWRRNNFCLIGEVHVPHEVDQIKDLEIRDSDVFAVTFPKSGTIWMQQILLLLESKGDLRSVNMRTIYSSSDVVSWIELKGQLERFIKEESRRMRVTHLPPELMPTALTQRKGKVIYVARNPKDVLVSFYYFYKLAKFLETPKSFDDFFDKFINGEVLGGSWFEHIKSWYFHKDEVNMLFITYEEMIMDLTSVVKKLADFLNIELTQDELQQVVKHSTFKNMKQISKANYKWSHPNLLDHKEGSFMRKGTIGDWKNHFTVAQNERFDELFEREMKDFPVSFIWDIRDVS